MKVIELLNKIANGEQPNHIVFDTDDWYWGYDSYIPKIFLETSPDVQATVSLFKKYRIDYCLNEEIEIIEEENNEEPKIEKLDNTIYSVMTKDKNNYETLRIEVLLDTINLIIDYINKGE